MRFRFADFVLDTDRFELSRGGRPVAVQPKVLDLILCLVRAPERTLTKQELLEAVWPGVHTGESSLTRAVSFARAALGEAESQARIIETVRGRGYRLGVPVAVDGATAAPRVDDFVGREAELAEATAALDAAARGRGQLLLLAGEPGIGKTRLAQEVEALARERGARVRWGRCHEGESQRAYWPWEQILRAELTDWDADRLAACAGEEATSEIAELLPELRLRLPELPRPSLDAEHARARLFDGVVALLRESAREAPLVLVLDDLHCADEPSLRLLRFVARDLAALSVLLVASYRDAGAPPLVRTFAELARVHPERRTLVLRGLDPASAEQLVRRRLGGSAPARLVEACRARSEGNPLFLRELLHWLESRVGKMPSGPAEVPEGIRHVLRHRLAELPEPSRTALEAAAILGREFPADLVATLLGITGTAVLVRLDPAEAAHLVEGAPGPPGRFRFTHGLIAETLREGLGAAQRARLHAGAAEALEARYRPRPLVPTREPLPIRDVHLAELAHHFAAALPAGDAAKALAYCERAGEHALALLAHEEAMRHFERALAVLDVAFPSDDAARARLVARRARASAGTVP
jgi:predicted ATPase